MRLIRGFEKRQIARHPSGIPGVVPGGATAVSGVWQFTKREQSATCAILLDPKHILVADLAQSLKTLLEQAASKGIISAGQIEPLAGHLTESGYAAMPTGSLGNGGILADLSLPKDGGPQLPSEESEAPRFVRGFHDVLITVGIVIALTGAAALMSSLVLVPAVILLAEILVKRQRLALPAFALTNAYVIGVVWLVFSALGNATAGTLSQMISIYAASAAALVPYYWRYRVPVSLAALILSAIGFCFFATLGVIGQTSLDSDAVALPALLAGLVFSLLAFGAAMYFDVRDRLRVTRRSDVAFWLHLGAAPALLNSALGLALWNSGSRGLWLQNLASGQAIVALLIITLFMLTGIAIDRRAFVTAGILSLGYVISTLIKGVNFESNNLFAISALAVGIIVLVIGTGWLPIRARVVAMLPKAIQDLVPPVAVQA